MAWSEALDEESFSVGFATQSDLNTVGASWTWIDCEMPQVTYDAAQTEQKRSRRSRGAGTKRLTGRVWPRVAVRFPVVGQLAAYAYASDTPGLKGANGLLNFLGGSAAIAYQAAGMSPTDGNTVSLVSSTGKLGCLVAGRESSGLVAAAGFIQALSGAGPYAATLFEDLAAQPGTSIARIPTLTHYPSASQPSPLSLRICGEDAAYERIFVGCVLSRVSFSFDADWRLYANAEFVCYGGETRDTNGGLQTVAECLALEPLMQRGGARFVVASNVFSTLNDGTVDPDGTCDVRNFEVTVEVPHYTATCPPKTEGVAEVVTRSPTITCAFSLPDISDFESSSEQFGEKAWRDITTFAVSLYMGDTPGRILAMNLPALMPTAYPEKVFVDGIQHRRFQCEVGHYVGDGASTDAGNKPLRFSVG